MTAELARRNQAEAEREGFHRGLIGSRQSGRVSPIWLGLADLALIEARRSQAEAEREGSRI